MSAVVVIDETHTRIADVLSGGERERVDERIVQRVNRNCRYADLVQIPLTAALAIVVELVFETVYGSNDVVVVVPNSSGRTHLLNIERPGEPKDLTFCFGFESSEEVLRRV